MDEYPFHVKGFLLCTDTSFTIVLPVFIFIARIMSSQ
jgi:hypothetical protein